MIKNTYIKLIIGIMAAVLVLSGTGNVFADEAQKQSLEAYLEEIAVGIDESNKKLDEIYNSIDEVNQQIESNTTALEILNESLEQQKEALSLRIKYMYESGTSMNILATILSSESISDIINKSEYISKIVDYDREKLEAYASTVEEIEKTQEDLQSRKAELIELKDSFESSKQEAMQTMTQVRQQLEAYDIPEDQVQTVLEEYMEERQERIQETEPEPSYEPSGEEPESEDIPEESSEEPSDEGVPEPDGTEELSEPETEPETTTTQPETTAKEPETTTIQPETTTKQQETTTRQPETTTKQPETTTTQPETTTKEPETTTRQPETTTKQPETTTRQPETTTEKPVEILIPTTTEAPAATPEETTTPYEEPATEYVEPEPDYYVPISTYGYSTKDIYDLARVTYLEDGCVYPTGSYTSVYLVACVILNRANNWYGGSISSAIYEPGAYATAYKYTNWGGGELVINDITWAAVADALANTDPNPYYQCNGDWLADMGLTEYYRDPNTDEVFYYDY